MIIAAYAGTAYGSIGTGYIWKAYHFAVSSISQRCGYFEFDTTVMGVTQ